MEGRERDEKSQLFPVAIILHLLLNAFSIFFVKLLHVQLDELAAFFNLFSDYLLLLNV